MQKYLKKKEKKLVKLVVDMSGREVRAARKKWKELSKRCYHKKKVAAELSARLDADTPPKSEAGETPRVMQQSRQMSVRKWIKRNRTKVMRLNQKLQKQNEGLRREVGKWRQRYYRSLKNKDAKSPSKLIVNLMNSGNKKKIA